MKTNEIFSALFARKPSKGIVFSLSDMMEGRLVLLEHLGALQERVKYERECLATLDEQQICKRRRNTLQILISSESPSPPPSPLSSQAARPSRARAPQSKCRLR